MAAGKDDLKGLIFSEEIPESTYLSDQNIIEYDSKEQTTSGEFSVGTVSSDTDQQQEFIIAVFVVSFDTRKGLTHVGYYFL